VIVEGDSSIYTGDAVDGNGTINIIYRPYPGGDDEPLPPSTPRTNISGSWKDW